MRRSLFSDERAFWRWMANPVHFKLVWNGILNTAIVFVGMYGWLWLVKHAKDSSGYAEILFTICTFGGALSGITLQAYKSQRLTSTDAGDPTENATKGATTSSTSEMRAAAVGTAMPAAAPRAATSSGAVALPTSVAIPNAARPSARTD